MNGLEIDQAVREILNGVTLTNQIQSATTLVALGFGAVQSLEIVRAVLDAKGRS